MKILIFVAYLALCVYLGWLIEPRTTRTARYVFTERYAQVGGYGYEDYYHVPYFHKPMTLPAKVKTWYGQRQMRLIEEKDG